MRVCLCVSFQICHRAVFFSIRSSRRAHVLLNIIFIIIIITFLSLFCGDILQRQRRTDKRRECDSIRLVHFYLKWVSICVLLLPSLVFFFTISYVVFRLVQIETHSMFILFYFIYVAEFLIFSFFFSLIISHSLAHSRLVLLSCSTFILLAAVRSLLFIIRSLSQNTNWLLLLLLLLLYIFVICLVIHLALK